MAFSFLLFFAYLIGSLPSAVWIGKEFYGKDVRNEGSKNAGATNVFRVLGKKAGWTVLLLDIGKGVLATSLLYLFPNLKGWFSDNGLNLMILGLAALLGHTFPVFAGFRGGKGVATLLGVVIVLHPFGSLIAIGSFLALFLSMGYVSVGSMGAATVFAATTLLNWPVETSIVLKVLGCFMAAFLFYTHRKNIERLRTGSENRFKIFKRTTNLP